MAAESPLFLQQHSGVLEILVEPHCLYDEVYVVRLVTSRVLSLLTRVNVYGGMIIFPDQSFWLVNRVVGSISSSVARGLQAPQRSAWHKCARFGSFVGHSVRHRAATERLQQA